MTDTYVENKIIEHLMKLDEFSGVLKCIKYFNENKETQILYLDLMNLNQNM